MLVTSFNPLKVYLYEDGLVRFCTQKYTNDLSSIKNEYAHLTNTAVNDKNKNAGNDLIWDFNQYKEECKKQGISYEHIFD